MEKITAKKKIVFRNIKSTAFSKRFNPLIVYPPERVFMHMPIKLTSRRIKALKEIVLQGQKIREIYSDETANKERSA